MTKSHYLILFVMTLLPIDRLKSEFLAEVKEHHLVVEAETGSGKSTRLPLWLAEHGRVLVIEPRRIACTSLAQFLAQSRGEQLGESVGYAIKLDIQYQPHTQVVFVTPGVALRWLAEEGLKSFDYVLVDEFHERRWDTDLLVALLREKNSHRLVVTSATIEGTKLAQYIDGKRLQAQGRRFEVEIQHVSRESHQLPDSRDIAQRVSAQVTHHVGQTDGDILVFLPGKKEIVACQQALANQPDLLVVPLHSSVSEPQKQQALTRQPQQKVVLATNVAETSLTIPNITLVIDSGLERRNEQRNGRTALALKAVSKASAQQRAGRAGRVMAGRCVRLYGQHAALSDVTPPQLHRESLTEPMLAAACCGVPLDRLTFLEVLPEKSFQAAKQLLVSMGALTEQGMATPHGNKLYPLPIDALYADLVTRMPSRPLQEAMVDLTAALCVPAKLFRLANHQEQIELLQQQEPVGCDGALIIGLVRGQHYDGITVDEEARQEAIALAEQMRAVFELPQLSVASRFSLSDLSSAIGKLHPELVFIRREKRRESMGNGKMEVTLGRESRLLSHYEAALVLDTHSVPGRGVKNTLNLATVTMPLTLSQLVDLDLGEWQQRDAQQTENGYQVPVELIYAGRVIERRYQAPTGQYAVAAIIEALKSDQLWPGFAKQREREIELWKLYQTLDDPLSKPSQTLNFDAWISHQLEMLEVSAMEDLMLFEPEDFSFDGVPEWEYQDFAQQYPFELQLADLTLRVEYFATRKLVHVIHQGGLRKGDPKRWELPRWNGWRIQYKKASRVVDIR